MKCCGNCFYRKVIIYDLKLDAVKLSCKKWYKMNGNITPALRDCWKELPNKIVVEH